jgi:hypothetical protein
MCLILTHDTKIFQHSDGLSRCVPCRSGPPSRSLSEEVCEDIDRLSHDITLLLLIHGGNEFMRIAMQTTTELLDYMTMVIKLGKSRDSHFMSSIANFLQLTRERFDRVARNEPCSFDSILVEQVQNAVDPNSSPENTPRNICRTSKLS